MTKKEFRKKCKEEKAASYKLMLLGGAFAIIGFIIIAATMLFIKSFTPQIIGFILGGIIALVGGILDCTGEVMLSKKFKEYKQ